MEGLTDDLRLTHGYLNALHSGFQGAFVARNVLDRLGHPIPAWMHPPDDLKETLEWIRGAVAGLFEGTPMLQMGVEPERDSAGARGLRFTVLLRNDLAAFGNEIIAALRVVRNGEEPGAASVVAAGLARQAYSREHYTTSEIRFAERFGLEEEADRWRQRLLSTQDEVRRATELFEGVAAGSHADELFRWELWSEAASLPGIVRSQLADLSSLDAWRTGDDGYARFALSDEEAALWQSAGIAPYAAAQWSAYAIAPAGVAAWCDAGLPVAASAGAWRLRGFSPSDAVPWIEAGYNPRDAAMLRGAGIADPSEIPPDEA